MTLSPGERHLLRLALKEEKGDGWAFVSAAGWPLISKLPTELIELQKHDDGSGKCRVTDAGRTVLKYV